MFSSWHTASPLFTSWALKQKHGKQKSTLKSNTLVFMGYFVESVKLPSQQHINSNQLLETLTCPAHMSTLYM